MPTLIDSIRQDSLLSRYAPKIAYVLSGGSAKGFAHLGMIGVLELKGIRPDLVVGTSAGALFGALYCHFGSVDGVLGRVGEVFASDEYSLFSRRYLRDSREDRVDDTLLSQFLSSISDGLRKSLRIGQSLATQSMVNGRDLSAIFAQIFRGIEFGTLGIPFAAVASDLGGAVPAVFDSLRLASTSSACDNGTSGDPCLARAVMASTAIPFLFPAVEIGGRDFADGYIMANLPVREARTLLDGERLFVAGFDVSPPLQRPDGDLSSLELAMRLLDLAAGSKQAADRELADILFLPMDRDHPWADFESYRSFIEIGRAYMKGDREDAFLGSYLAKCFRVIGQEPNPVRRIAAAGRLRSLARKYPPASL